MATPISAAALLAVLKAEGVIVQEYKDWRTHRRPKSTGTFGGVNGVMIHHTVSSADDSSVALCYNGHSALPGPLCHAVGRNDGKVALVSIGRANHAGKGDDDVLAAVIAERATLPAANEANTDGNTRFYGIEIVNMGDNKDTYTKKQYEAAVRWAAALCRHHGWSERSVIGHKEWQPGKIDPRGPIEGGGSFSMSTFRADVKAALALPAGKWRAAAAPAPTKPTTPKPTPGATTVRLSQLSRQESLTIPSGATKIVYFTAADVRDDPNEHGAGGYTVLSSPAAYTGTVSVWDDAVNGEALSLLVVQELADGSTSTSSTAALAGHDGGVLTTSITGFLPAGRKLRVEIKNHGALSVTLPRVDLRVLSVAE